MSTSPPPLIFVATRTTGSDSATHEILELALIAENGDIVFNTAFAPENLHLADPAYLEAAGYNDGEWAPSPASVPLAKQILGHLTGVAVGGHATLGDMAFVERFLKDQLGDAEVDGKLSTLFVDVMTLAWDRLTPLGIPNLTLEAICYFLNIRYKASRSALEDARATRAIYKKLKSGKALQFWRMVVYRQWGWPR